MEPTRIFSTPLDVDQRLAQMGLTKAILLDAVRRGIGALALCTPNHPVSFPGSSMG
jgi:hypothetical protein